MTVDVVTHRRQPARVRMPRGGNPVAARGSVTIGTYAILEWDLSPAASLAPDEDAALAEVVA
ncbi:MAG: hypothetical protein ACSLFM_14560 [Tepidiformaceae bacterium]